MSIFRIKVEKGFIYEHRWDDAENVNARDYILSQYNQSFIIRYLPAIDRCLGTCPLWLYKAISNLCYNKTLSHLIWILNTTKVPTQFYDIINHPMRKKQQEQCLKNASLSPEQLMSILVYAGSQGYSLSHYSFSENLCSDNELNRYAFIRKDGTLNTNIIGKSDKEIKYNLEHKELINAFILDKGDLWLGFFQRKRSILGKETGRRGSVPHLHFISNAFGRKRIEFVTAIKNGNCPDSSVHINLKEYI